MGRHYSKHMHLFIWSSDWSGRIGSFIISISQMRLTEALRETVASYDGYLYVLPWLGHRAQIVGQTLLWMSP